MFLLSSITFKVALPRGTSPLWDAATKCITWKKNKGCCLGWHWHRFPSLTLGWRDTSPTVHMGRGEQTFWRVGFSCRAALEVLPKAMLREAKPSPRSPPARTRFYHGFQTAPACPGEGRGAALMLWLRVTSAHPGWRCYQSPCTPAGLPVRAEQGYPLCPKTSVLSLPGSRRWPSW